SGLLATARVPSGWKADDRTIPPWRYAARSAPVVTSTRESRPQPSPISRLRPSADRHTDARRPSRRVQFSRRLPVGTSQTLTLSSLQLSRWPCRTSFDPSRLKRAPPLYTDQGTGLIFHSRPVRWSVTSTAL